LNDRGELDFLHQTWKQRSELEILFEAGAIVCWGRDAEGESDAPSGVFAQVAAGAGFACALRTNGKTVCWGDVASGATKVPAGAYKQISAGGGSDDFNTGSPPNESWGIACGVKTSGGLVCWGGNSDVSTVVPAGSYSQVSTGTGYSCAIKISGKLACWGVNGAPGVPTGTFAQVSASRFGGGYPASACGVRTSGTVVCWGTDAPKPVPVGTFKAVSSEDSRACATRSNGAVVCWGLDNSGLGAVPKGSYTEITMGGQPQWL
jgi:hypothetical protein